MDPVSNTKTTLPLPKQRLLITNIKVRLGNQVLESASNINCDCFESSTASHGFGSSQRQIWEQPPQTTDVVSSWGINIIAITGTGIK